MQTAEFPTYMLLAVLHVLSMTPSGDDVTNPALGLLSSTGDLLYSYLY